MSLFDNSQGLWRDDDSSLEKEGSFYQQVDYLEFDLESENSAQQSEGKDTNLIKNHKEVSSPETMIIQVDKKVT